MRFERIRKFMKFFYAKNLLSLKRYYFKFSIRHLKGFYMLKVKIKKFKNKRENNKREREKEKYIFYIVVSDLFFFPYLYFLSIRVCQKFLADFFFFNK